MTHSRADIKQENTHVSLCLIYIFTYNDVLRQIVTIKNKNSLKGIKRFESFSDYHFRFYRSIKNLKVWRLPIYFLSYV